MGKSTILCILLLSTICYCISDCYYDVAGGCVLLSLPDTNGDCFNFYKNIISSYSPSGCYDGYYSQCTCAIYNPTLSCASFATYGTTAQCPQDWIDAGNSMINLNIDPKCTTDKTTQFVPGQNDACGKCPCSNTSDCYFDTLGGCALLSKPDVNGNCLSFYQTIINKYSPIGCYNGYYSQCTCVTYNPALSCEEFATLNTIGHCTKDLVDAGNSMISFNTDPQCSTNPAAQFVIGPNVCLTEPLVVQGNQIYKSISNNVWAGKGVNLQDTRACGVGCIRSVEEVTRRIDYLFGNFDLDWIRLTLEADNIQYTVLNDNSYWQDIKNIVAHIGSKPGKYVEITLFKDPSLGADPNVPGGPSSVTGDTWEFMATYFKNQSHVIFGIVNEPEARQDNMQKVAALLQSMNDVVQRIRKTGANNLILVQCLAFSSDCSLYANNQIVDGNVAYEIHLYSKDLQIDSSLSYNLPFVVSETGVINDPVQVIFEGLDDYLHLVQVCNNKRIPYAGWSFDETCGPAMIDGFATNSNGCGAQNDLSAHTIWGKIFLDNIYSTSPFR